MKVRIYRDQPVPENPTLFVKAETGDYDPFDVLECYSLEDPTRPIAAFQAQYLKFGGLVYREEEYLVVLESLGLVDLTPETLTDMLLKDQSTIVVDKNPLENIPDTVPAAVEAVSVPADSFATTTIPLPVETQPVDSGGAVSSPDVSLGTATTTIVDGGTMGADSSSQ